jgi:2-polyprenyl-6-methoxyphenol hydroxylase-like FAD-dependent oxidoreductase
MKNRAEEFAGPLRRLVHGIPDDSEQVTPLTLADFATLDWESHDKVTLAGDAAHAMTMYRGEGANHGILDAALLVDQLIRVMNGEVDQKEAIAEYEKEMKPRCRAAVLKSRQAALDGHCTDAITADGPLIGSRFPPATA